MVLRKNSVHFHIEHSGVTPADHSTKNPLPALDFPEHGTREGNFAIRTDRRKLDKLFGVAHRNVAKEQSVYKREDGSIGADSQGERKHRYCCEAGRIAQNSTKAAPC